ncbi:unnamed protein product, partial [Didymodactylos carnosus]
MGRQIYHYHRWIEAVSNCTFPRNFPNQVIRWSKQTRGLILGSFYAGYILTQVASGIIGLYIGPRIFYSFIVCLSSLCTILVPIIAKLHPSVMVLSRIIMGAAQ